MVTQPGAGLHICFPDDKGERVAMAVLHADKCARCGVTVKRPRMYKARYCGPVCSQIAKRNKGKAS